MKDRGGAPSRVIPEVEFETLLARAREGLAEANAGLPPKESSLLVAGLAHYLALRGQAKKVSVTVPCSEDAARVVLEFLNDQRGGGHPETPLRGGEGGQAGPEGLIAPARFPHASADQSGEGIGGREGCLPDEIRECTSCGASFVVNLRHRRNHRFCSASCRWRAAHHRRNEGPSESQPPAQRGNQ